MPTPHALNHIKKQYHSLSEAEKKIAAFILENPHKAVNLTLRVLAQQADVSQGSVINFAGRMGYDGYTALRIGIAQSLSAHNSLIFHNVTERDGPRDAVRKMIANATSAFQSTLDINTDEDFRRAAGLLSAAHKRVEVYGVATSSMVALDAYYRLLRIGLPATAVTDALICPVSASMLSKDCLAIAISYTGRTDAIVKTMRIAKAQGAATLALTSYAGSPLAQLCDVSLIIASKESQIHSEPTVSRLAQLLLVDSLCAYINYQHRDEALTRRARIDEILDDQYL